MLTAAIDLDADQAELMGLAPDVRARLAVDLDEVVRLCSQTVAAIRAAGGADR